MPFLYTNYFISVSFNASFIYIFVTIVQKAVVLLSVVQKEFFSVFFNALS